MTTRSLSYFCDTMLSRRLEIASAHASREAADSARRYDPTSNARSLDVAGGIAAFCGPDSPLTQAFGLGFDGAVDDASMDALEGFFRECGSDVCDVEASPYADISLAERFGERGYRPIEFSNVLVLPLAARNAAEAGEVIVRRADASDEDAFVRAISRGFAESDEMAEVIAPIARIGFGMAQSHGFVAEHDGRVIAAGSMGIRDGIASMSGAATLPDHRRLGAQTALYAYRLDYAASHGCDYATVSTQPGSGSQRNAERHGFRVVYTRTKWRLTI